MSNTDTEERAARSAPERVQKIESLADDLDAERAGVLREADGATMLSCWGRRPARGLGADAAW